MNLARRVLLLVLCMGCLSLGLAQRSRNNNTTNGNQQFLLILGIVPGSTADRLEFKQGDILRAYDGNGIETIEELEVVMDLAMDSVEIIIDREDQTLSFIVPSGPLGVYLQERLAELEYKSDAVVLEGIGPFRSEDGMNNSFILTLAKTAEFLNDTTGYTMLMGLSGAAFRLQMHQDWDPMAVVASEGYRCDTFGLQALGYEYRCLEIDEQMRNVEALREAIVQTLDFGSPVPALNLDGQSRWGVITGYQRSGREFIVRTYGTKRTGYSLNDAFPTKICLIEGRDAPMSRREAIIRSFKIAQGILENQTMVDGYYCGKRGMEIWIQVLETGSFYDLNEDEFDRILAANYAMYTSLIEDREFAAQYLETIAPEFPDIQDKLLEMAELYRNESEHLSLALGEYQTCVVLPGELDRQMDWTPDMRIRQLNYLYFARGNEDEALRTWREINAVYHPEFPEDSLPVDSLPPELEVPEEVPPEEVIEEQPEEKEEPVIIPGDAH